MIYTLFIFNIIHMPYSDSFLYAYIKIKNLVLIDCVWCFAHVSVDMYFILYSILYYIIYASWKIDFNWKMNVVRRTCATLYKLLRLILVDHLKNNRRKSLRIEYDAHILFVYIHIYIYFNIYNKPQNIWQIINVHTAQAWSIETTCPWQSNCNLY